MMEIDKTVILLNNKQETKLSERRIFSFSKAKFKIKFIFEWSFAALMVMLLSPIFILTSIFIKFSSPGPIFFLQKRIGYNQKEFNIIKFRSLRLAKDEEENKKSYLGFKPERLTKIGYFIRRTKIDELPQLFNILKGEMGIVGPRPHLEEDFKAIAPLKLKARGEIRPGLTGLRQTNGNTALSAEEEIYYDLFYIKTWNFIFDIKIIFKTFLIIVFGEKRFIKHVNPTLLEKKDV